MSTKQRLYPDDARRGLLVGTAFLALSVPLIAEASSEYILVPISEDFGLSIDAVNYLAIVPTVASLVAVFLAGSLAVRYGRRAVLMWAGAITCAGAIVLSLAPSIPFVYAGRVLCGVGGVPLAVIGLSLVNISFTQPAQRARMFGVLAALTPVVYIVAPVAGSLVATFSGWRWVPMLWLLAAAATVILARAAVPGKEVTSAPAELVTPILGGLALALVCLAMSLAGLGLVPWALVALAAATGIIGALAIVIHRVPRPSLDLRVLRSPGAMLAAGAIVFSVAIEITYFVNLYIQYRYSLPLPYLALLAVLPELTGIVGSLSFGLLASHRGTGPAAMLALTAAAILPLCILLLGPGSSVWLVVLACVIVNFPIAGSVGPLTEFFLNGAPEDGSDAASAVADALTNVRAVMLSAVVGLIAFASFQQALTNRLVDGGVAPDRAGVAASEIRDGVSSMELSRSLPGPDDPLKDLLSEPGTAMEEAQYEALRVTSLIMTIGGGLSAVMLGLSIRRRRSRR